MVKNDIVDELRIRIFEDIDKLHKAEHIDHYQKLVLHLTFANAMYVMDIHVNEINPVKVDGGK